MIKINILYIVEYVNSQTKGLSETFHERHDMIDFISTHESQDLRLTHIYECQTDSIESKELFQIHNRAGTLIYEKKPFDINRNKYTFNLYNAKTSDYIKSVSTLRRVKNETVRKLNARHSSMVALNHPDSVEKMYHKLIKTAIKDVKKSKELYQVNDAIKQALNVEWGRDID